MNFSIWKYCKNVENICRIYERLSYPLCSPRLFAECCLLLCWIFTFAHTPSLDYQKPLPSNWDNTAGQRPKRDQPIFRRRGENPNAICMAWSTRQPDGSQADLPEAVFLIYFSAQGHVRQGGEKHVSPSKLSGLSCGLRSIRSSYSAECNGSRSKVLRAFTSDVFSFEVGQGVCGR